MNFSFGTDDPGPVSEAVVAALRERGTVTIVRNEPGEWPMFSKEVAEAVQSGSADFGVLLCWTGTGTAMAANKVRGVRDATVWDPWVARNARAWNGANVIAMSTRRLSPDVAVECLEAFLTAEVDEDERPNINLIEWR